MPVAAAAEGGYDAIYGAGKAVNHLDLTSTQSIRKAIPTARGAALAVKSWLESRDTRAGDFTGLPIAIYQNWLYEQNREWHFTDGTLCVLWSVEFPLARCDYADKHHYVASTRTEYNAGRHQAPAPAIPSVAYDRDGHPLGASARRFAQTTPTPPRLVSRSASEKATHVGDAEPAQTGLALGRPPQERVHASGPLSFASDPVAARRRVADLDAYMAEHVLDQKQLRCSAFGACRSSHDGKFFAGQLHHVGAHFDISVNGRPFRIAVVGQEYGNGPALVSRVERSNDVAIATGLRKRFSSDGEHPARNPHMRGTTSLLRLLFGRGLGRDYSREFLTLDGSTVHIFEAFALTNFLLCSAISEDESDTGSKRGKSTTTMRRNCARHFEAAMRILEPTVIVSQGMGVREWMDPLVGRAVSISPNLERATIAGRPCLVATFAHPSVPSKMNWGTDERRPYLLEVVAPTVSAIHREVIGG